MIRFGKPRVALCKLRDNNVNRGVRRGRPVRNRGVEVVVGVWLTPHCPFPKPHNMDNLFGAHYHREYIFWKWWS